VDFIVGYIWSNVLLASLKPAIDSKTIMISANAGPSQIAGELCSPYFFSASRQNDQTAAAVGLYMNQKAVGNAYLIGPNYAAGKDMMAGVVDRDSPGRILSSVPDCDHCGGCFSISWRCTHASACSSAPARPTVKWSVRSASTSNRSTRLCSASGRLSRVLLD
jgi:hypothetical protein